MKSNDLDKEENSIEALPDFDKEIIKDWRKRRTSIRNIGNITGTKSAIRNFNTLQWRNSFVKKPPERIEKEDLNKRLKKEIQPETNSLPSHISKKYVEVNGKFYFNYDTKKLAFVDKGKKLSTSLNETGISKTMVDIAESRGWSKIKLKGKEDFRREAWLEAQSRGLKTEGYNPKENDYAALKLKMSAVQKRKAATERDPESNKPLPEERSKTPPSPEQKEKPQFKTLVDFGVARYQNNPKNTKSYYAELRDNETQKTSTVWGKEIEKTLQEVNAKKGDKIILEKGGKKSVTVENVVKDSNGKVVDRKQIDTHRNEWKATTEHDFTAEKKAEIIRTEEPKDILVSHPELKNEIIALEVAKKFSKQSGMSKEDGRRFFEQARKTLAQGVSNGDQVPEIKLKTPVREKDIKREVENENIR